MAENGDGEASLSELYAQAVLAYEEMGRASNTESACEACIGKLRECQRMTSTLHLFSWNESAEDLSTASLR